MGYAYMSSQFRKIWTQTTELKSKSPANPLQDPIEVSYRSVPGASGGGVFQMGVLRRCSPAMEAALLALFLELCVGCHGFKKSSYQIKAAFSFATFSQLDLLAPKVDSLDCIPLCNPTDLQHSFRAEQQTLRVRTIAAKILLAAEGDFTGVLLALVRLHRDEDMPPVTQVSHMYEGLITRSRAKLLQKEVNSLLAEINFDIFENVILPKHSILVVLRHTNKEEDVTLHRTSTEKNGQQFGPSKNDRSDQYSEK
ncbi:unnamed protein product [Miscanthus lutarioriparius]|uniref:Uncharacterized protein n=1 Tax=Miscanthus lutarioriparius TaxID=422564 RepID=A0A811PGR4_9POAL|nr:unnamed protein product [Miscanthus lutarioriparius]